MSRTITIPGGEAVMFDQQNEISPRRRREVEIVASRIGRRLEQITKCARILIDGDVIDDSKAELLKEDGSPRFVGDVEISEKELRLLARLNDVNAWAMLSSWTLPEPLPADPDALLDINPDLYGVLREESAKISAEWADQGDPFTVDALPADPNEEADLSLPTSA